MASELLPFLHRATNDNGNPISGARLFFYTTGTTTPASVYTDAELTTQHPSPVVSDSNGLFAAIYLDPAVTYRAILQDGAGVEIWDIDPINDSAELASTDLIPLNVADYGDLIFDDDSPSARATNTATAQAAYNAASKASNFMVGFPAGRLHLNTLREYYDVTDNPGFNDTSDNLLRRDGLFRTIGQGALSIKNARDYDTTNIYGTVLHFHGDGLIISDTPGAPYPSRRAEFKDITLVGDSAMTGDQVLDSPGCPFISFDHTTIIQRKTTGNGALVKNAWGMDTNRFICIGTGSGHTGDGLVMGGTISAGSIELKDTCIIDGFRDNVVWEEGVWRVLRLSDAWLQAAQRHSINITGGAIDILDISNCHFEGDSRASDIKSVAGGIKILRHKGNYHLCGDNEGNSHLSAPVIDLAGVEAVEVEGNTGFRILGTFCNIDAATNGECPGYSRHNVFLNDTSGLSGGPYDLYTGVLPDIEDHVWTGFGAGLEGSSVLRLYDTTGSDHPNIYKDKRSDTFSVRNLALSKPTITTGQSGTLALNATSNSVHDVTNTVASSVALPTHAVADLTNGRMFLVSNNASSTGPLNVRYGSGGAVLRALEPGQSAVFVFDRASTTYFVFGANVEPQASPSPTYSAPSGGATIDAEARTAIAANAADLAALVTQLETAGVLK